MSNREEITIVFVSAAQDWEKWVVVFSDGCEEEIKVTGSSSDRTPDHIILRVATGLADRRFNEQHTSIQDSDSG